MSAPDPAITIQVRCKKCRRSATLRVHRADLGLKQGLWNVLIPRDVVCPHAFLAFLDNKFAVRGYQQVDHAFTRENLAAQGLLDLNEETTTRASAPGLVSAIQEALREFNLLVENVKAVVFLGPDGDIVAASELAVQFAGDFSSFIQTVSEFCLGISHRLQLADAPQYLELHGATERVRIHSLPFGYLVISHENPNQGLLAIATRKLIARLAALHEGGGVATPDSGGTPTGATSFGDPGLGFPAEG